MRERIMQNCTMIDRVISHYIYQMEVTNARE